MALEIGLDTFGDRTLGEDGKLISHADAIRNVVVNVADEQLKLKALGVVPPQEPSGIVILHNTFVSPEIAFNLQTPATTRNLLMAGNLFVGPSPAGPRVVDYTGQLADFSMDHDGWFPDGRYDFNAHGDYPSFAAMTTGGVLEPNATLLGQPIFASGLTAPASYTLALPGPLPTGIGSADFELSTDLPLWATTVSDMSGRFRLRMGPGTLTHFNRPAFEQRAAQNTFFSASDVADGAFDFVRADMDAKLNRGLAELTKAEIEGTDRLLTLSGLIPYRTGSLALAGSLADRPQEGVAPNNPAISFFVGGSWPEPVISPIAILTGQEPRR